MAFKKREERDDHNPRKPAEKKGFWSSTATIMVVLFVAGLIIGIALDSQVVQPMLNAGNKKLAECEKRYDLSEQQVNQCISCLAKTGSSAQECFSQAGQ